MAYENRIPTKCRYLISDQEAPYVIEPPGRKNRPVSCPAGTLRQRQSKYAVNQTGLLQPYLDSSAGLEKWPANSGGHGSGLLHISKERQLKRNDETKAPTRGPVVPKPRFLEHIESFLKKELHTLGVSNTSPGDLRLQVYREAFDLLIQDFKTYQPILSAIKNEYEMMLIEQSNKIRKLEPLKQMLVTVSEQCDQKIIELRDKEKQDVKEMRHAMRELCGEVSRLRDRELTLQAESARLREELMAEHGRLREEKDLLKLLRGKMQDLTQKEFEEIEQEVDDRADPVILQIKLDDLTKREAYLKEQVEQKDDRLQSFLDFVPMKEHEEFKTRNEQLERDLTILQEELDERNEHYDSLQRRYAELKTECEKLELEQAESEKVTPRPKWDKCADYIEGGFLRWREVSHKKSSSQLLGILLRELTKQQGADDRANPIQQSAKVEEGMMLVACQLAIELTKLSAEAREPADSGLVYKPDFRKLLDRVFPNKDEKNKVALFKAAETQLEAAAECAMYYDQLFMENKQCQLGEFLEELGEQYSQERRTYIEQIEKHLQGADPVEVDDLRKAFMMNDPEVAEKDKVTDKDPLSKYLCYAFDVASEEELETAEPVPLHVMQNRLLRGMLHRIGGEI